MQNAGGYDINGGVDSSGKLLKIANENLYLMYSNNKWSNGSWGESTSDIVSRFGGSTEVQGTLGSDSFNFSFVIEGETYTVTSGVVSPSIPDWP